MGLPQVHVVGGFGYSGSLSFLWRKILNSSVVNLLVVSVLVDWPRGMDVRVLKVDGKCFWISLGSVGHIRLSLLMLIIFCICVVAALSGTWRVYVSSEYGCLLFAF